MVETDTIQCEVTMDDPSYLTAAIDHLRAVLQAYLDQKPLKESAPPFFDVVNPPPIEMICNRFGLSDFERKLLLLCVGVSLDQAIGRLCAAINGDDAKPWASFDLALRVFNGEQWQVFNACSTLRHWRLVELDSAYAPQLSPLRLDENLLHFIVGEPTVDARLLPLLLPVFSQDTPVDSHARIAEQITYAFSNPAEAVYPLIQLSGSEPEAKQFIAKTAFDAMGLLCYAIDTQRLPSDSRTLHQLYLQLEREYILKPVGYYFELSAASDIHDASQNSLIYLLQRLNAPCVIGVAAKLHCHGREQIVLEVGRPSYDEQYQLWQSALGATSGISDSGAHCIVDQFNMGAQQIQSVAHQWQSIGREQRSFDALWSLCRKQARDKIAGLARIIEPGSAAWSSLILPDKEKQTLHTILEQVSHRHQVYRQWGFADSGAYGLGIAALFSGSSGTGKTLAARVIANALQLDIYHIDLAAMVSKYIGETEKNLEQIFRAAESSGAILLFDEADALFGKRSQVNDSKDRYANMEVSYLLQRMESYEGLSILTTNYKSAMDPAFLRRLRFIVQFPFPQAAEREKIWRGVFPKNTPTENLHYDKLARLEIPGGVIRSVAVNAAFHGAGAGSGVTMQHLLQAVREEYTKSEKTLLPELVADWVE